jgi:hypothetical protein
VLSVCWRMAREAWPPDAAEGDTTSEGH